MLIIRPLKEPVSLRNLGISTRIYELEMKDGQKDMAKTEEEEEEEDLQK